VLYVLFILHKTPFHLKSRLSLESNSKIQVSSYQTGDYEESCLLLYEAVLSGTYASTFSKNLLLASPRILHLNVLLKTLNPRSSSTRLPYALVQYCNQITVYGNHGWQLEVRMFRMPG
jgi:hypothetical protein